MDSDVIVVTNDQGEEKEYTILFTFENNDKSYVLYYDKDEEEPEVFASIYDEEGHLFDVETPEEWDMINDVFESFMASDDEEEEEHECGCGHHHHDGEGCGCGHHHDEDHECGCGHHHDEDHECGCGHHHDEDHECGCGHHHDEDHECGCGHHHH